MRCLVSLQRVLRLQGRTRTSWAVRYRTWVRASRRDWACGCWMAIQCTTRMVRFALGQSADALDRSVVLLCASMAEPWLLLDALNSWSAILNDQVANAGVYDERAHCATARDRRESRA